MSPNFKKIITNQTALTIATLLMPSIIILASDPHHPTFRQQLDFRLCFMNCAAASQSIRVTPDLTLTEPEIKLDPDKSALWARRKSKPEDTLDESDRWLKATQAKLAPRASSRK